MKKEGSCIQTKRCTVVRILLFLVLVLPVSAFAQKISVSHFALAENDLTANSRGTTMLDQNGDKCALIRVQTTQKGFVFDVGSAGIQKVDDNHTGEIWVYVPFGVRHISIRHPQLGSLINYNFPISIQKARTYIMEITTGQVKTIVQQDLGGAYLVMNVSPANALVYVDEVEQTVEDGMVTKFLSYGKHSYRVSANLYESEAGNIEMGREKQVRDISLKPAYGQLSITTTPESGARVYIDGSETLAGTTPFTTGKLAGGSHTLLLQLAQYESYRMTVSVPSDGSTQPLAVPLTPNFGTLSVSSAGGCHIYVNGEDKGASPWTGRLSAGQYVVEARQASHRSTSQRVDVVRGKEQSIELAAPTPIYGSLNVSSKPADADVYVDGTKVGSTPDAFKNILEGTRSVELRKQGYAAYTAEVNVTEGKVSDLSATLSVEEKPNQVDVVSHEIDREKQYITYEEDVKWLYGELRENGYNLGSEEEFTLSLTNKENLDWYYDKATSMGLNVGSREHFDEIFNPNVRLDKMYRNHIGNAVLDNLISNMVYVEGGTFTMGATSEQGSDANRDESPVHSVTLASYYIGKYEVTQVEWRAIMGRNPSRFSDSEDLPVEFVSWTDCQRFIEKLNAETGLKFRLPTEAEWEYAARGGNKSRGYKYAGSINLGNVAWYADNSSEKTQVVGTKQPNELGLYDMSGNVSEWCSDRNDSYSSDSQTNPTGASSGSYRVLRGGSWQDNAKNCRVSKRDYNTPVFRRSYLGLRLVLEVQQEEK